MLSMQHLASKPRYVSTDSAAQHAETIATVEIQSRVTESTQPAA